MKTYLLLGLVLLTLGARVSSGAEWRPLFDGTREGWRSWLAHPHASCDIPDHPRNADGKFIEPLGWDRDPLKVFTVVDHEGAKVLRASGQIYGVLMTTESLANFHLRLQFKWGEKKWPPRAQAIRDSGLLYFVHGEPGMSYGAWPGCLELQIQEHDCGDLYALLAEARVTVRRLPPSGQYPLMMFDPTAQPVVLAQEGPDGNRGIKSADFEHPSGEWNTLELVCVGATSIHVVNGHVVLRLSDARRQPDGSELMSGPIALQSEGAETFFRQIEVRSITSVPAEFAGH